MFCPSCQKRVVFGSVAGPIWDKIHSEEWIHGSRAPAPGKLGDCPVCGVRLEWEPGEHDEGGDPSRPASSRVHLSALRESAQAWRGKRIWMRALVIEIAGTGFLSDSWRARVKGSTTSEDDRALLARLEKEQTPRVAAKWGSIEARAQFGESARILDAEGSPRAAWAEVDGRFDLKQELRVLTIDHISSIWPPRE